MQSLRDEISLTRICTDCGEEVECGLRNSIIHDNVCKRNAPNESIEFHQHQVQEQKWDEEEERMLNAIQNICSAEEKKELSLLSIGVPLFSDDKIIMMGSKQFNRRLDFINKMKQKYNLR